MPLSKIRSIQSWFCWFFIGKGFITFSRRLHFSPPPLSLVTDRYLKEHTSLWKRSPGRNLRVLLTNKAETAIHGCHMSGRHGARAYVDGLIRGLVLAYVRAPAYVYLAFSLFFPFGLGMRTRFLELWWRRRRLLRSTERIQYFRRFSFPRVLIVDARSFQALVAIVDYVTNLASMSC